MARFFVSNQDLDCTPRQISFLFCNGQLEAGEGENLPGVSIRVNSRKGNTAVEHFEVWLVLQHEIALGGGGHRLGEAHHGIVGDDAAGSGLADGCGGAF